MCTRALIDCRAARAALYVAHTGALTAHFTVIG
jgi:hypothetical protein